MAAATGMGVRGIDVLVASLDAAATELASLVGAHTEAGQLLTVAGSNAAPRRTGHLAASHAATVTAGRVEVVNSADYAPYVHARNPWLARALEQHLTELLDVYATGVADVVDTITGV